MSYQTEVEADAPVAWYRHRSDGDLVEGVVQDSSGNGYHFDTNAMTYTLTDGGPTGGKYADWDGGGIGAAVVAATGMDGASVAVSGYALLFWIMLPAAVTPVQIGDVGDTDELLHAAIANPDTGSYTIAQNWFADDLASATEESVMDGWHMVTLTYDANTNLRKTYLDTSEIASGEPAGAPAWSNLLNVLCGEAYKIGEQEFYDHPLTAARILAHYTSATAPAPSAPAAPTGVVATPGRLRIGLGWVASMGATDYRVSRSTDNETFAVVATVAAPATTYIDYSLTPAVTYFYKVTARAESEESDPSETVSAAPLRKRRPSLIRIRRGRR